MLYPFFISNMSIQLRKRIYYSQLAGAVCGGAALVYRTRTVPSPRSSDSLFSFVGRSVLVTVIALSIGTTTGFFWPVTLPIGVYLYYKNNELVEYQKKNENKTY